MGGVDDLHSAVDPSVTQDQGIAQDEGAFDVEAGFDLPEVAFVLVGLGDGHAAVLDDPADDARCGAGDAVASDVGALGAHGLDAGIGPVVLDPQGAALDMLHFQQGREKSVLEPGGVQLFEKGFVKVDGLGSHRTPLLMGFRDGSVGLQCAPRYVPEAKKTRGRGGWDKENQNGACRGGTFSLRISRGSAGEFELPGHATGSVPGILGARMFRRGEEFGR